MIRRFQSAKEKRKARTRAKIKGTLKRPRLSVFRSNRYIYAQVINDEKGETLVAASDRVVKKLKSRFSTPESGTSNLRAKKIEIARLVGKEIANKALKAGIKKVVFDRGPYKYHGRVKALAEGAREGGLSF